MEADMAITPRTILSQPINLLLFALSIMVLGGLLGVLAGVSNSRARLDTRHIPPDVEVDPNQADWNQVDSSWAGEDTGVAGLDDNEPTDSRDAMVVGAEPDYRDYICRLQEPGRSWTEGQWLRHLGCMKARGEADEVLLDETTAAIDAVGLTPDLGVEKADLLKAVETPDDHIAFLDAAVTQLGVSDGRLVHRLAQALTWRAEADDIERIRHLQLLSRMLMRDSCEVQQTEIWVRYALADKLAEAPSPAAWHGAKRAIASYVADDCHERLDRVPQVQGRSDRGRPDVLAEIVGVGVVAEATSGHSAQSTLIRQVVDSYELRGRPDQVSSFCREAVPAGVGLRAECEKRVADELFLSR
jgi:hypothetical protein